MAEKKSVSDELDDLAFRILMKRIEARGGLKANTVKESEIAYGLAWDFREVAKRVAAGEIDLSREDERPKRGELQDCSLPNQRPTAPLNLISRRFGDLSTVRQVQAWLESNPLKKDASNAEEVYDSFTAAFPQLNWSQPELNVARATYGDYAAPAVTTAKTK